MGKMMASKAPNTALPPATPTVSRPDGSPAAPPTANPNTALPPATPTFSRPDGSSAAPPTANPNTALPPATPTFSRPDGSPATAPTASPNTALPPATPTFSRPDGSPAAPPTASGGGFSETSFIPICKQDAFGKYVQWNDREYDSPNTKVVTSKSTTFASTDKNYKLVNQAAVDIKSITVSVVSLPTLSETLKTSFARIGIAAGVLSLGLNLLGPLTGFGGQSTDDAILKTVTEGFQQLNDRLTDLQEQIRTGFLDVSILVGDVVLDALASDLDATFRAYQNYVNATNETRPFYDSTFRAVCNAPFHTPQDVFYNLYGFACSNCTFASFKRVNLIALAAKQNRFSPPLFMSKFGNFIVQSMFNALYLHSVCLPPIEGSCVDHSTDKVWLAGVERMQKAANESSQVITDTAAQLADWVKLITVDDLKKFVPDDIGPNPSEENQKIADSIFAYLKEAQPDFYFQILVGDTAQDFDDFNQLRLGCQKGVEDCSTVLDKTGHLMVDSFNKRFISIRYRLKTAPQPPEKVSLESSEKFFGDFYNDVLEPRLGAGSLETLIPRPDGRPYCQKNGIPRTIDFQDYFFLIRFSACLVDICFACNDAELSEFNRILSSKSYYIRREPGERNWMNIAEKVDDPSLFPRFTAKFGGEYMWEQVDTFIWYYG
jgi:hypothetical protein